MIDKSTLRLITAGSVDNGKSTLIGRLLFDVKALSEDQLREAEQSSRKRGRGRLDLSFFTDGLAEEREQGITIDVAYRFFNSANRRFILADCPGHAQYTRNMITGASTADVALILVDVRTGLTEQTCRHICLASLLGVSAIVICVNKMDVVGYEEECFHAVKESVTHFTAGLSGSAIHCIPVSALEGDNVVSKSGAMPWYTGCSVLEFLDAYTRPTRGNEMPRFPVQYVFPYNGSSDVQACAGRVAGGRFNAGREVLVLPSGDRAVLRSIEWDGHCLNEASYGMSVLFTMEGNCHVRRGDMIVGVESNPQVSLVLRTTLCWLSESPLNAGDRFILRHTSREVICTVGEIHNRIDILTRRSEEASVLNVNDIGGVTIHPDEGLPADVYDQNRETGSFILVALTTGNTVAAGMINDLV